MSASNNKRTNSVARTSSVTPLKKTKTTTASQKVEVSESEFKSYVRIQNSGMYNMVTEGVKVMKLAGLSEKVYMEILRSYSELEKKYSTKKEEKTKDIKCPRCKNTDGWSIHINGEPSDFSRKELSKLQITCAACQYSNSASTRINLDEKYKKYFTSCTHEWEYIDIHWLDTPSILWDCKKCELWCINEEDRETSSQE